jgi:enamine deaminase RidA (YjgF/YER057c/UK114 family)
LSAARPIRRLGGDPPSPYEARFAFSRTLSFGDYAIVGGTTSINEDGVVVGDTPYEQAVEILRKIEHELDRAGAGLADVVQMRIYVTDISRGQEVGRAHGERFGAHPPVMTMIEVGALIDPRMLVEMEAVAYLG